MQADDTKAVREGGEAVEAVARVWREDAIREVVGLCNRIPGSTQWNAAEFMYDLLDRAAIAAIPSPPADTHQLDALANENVALRQALERIATARVAFNAHPVGVIETMREWARAALTKDQAHGG